jgi:hypothetical protein
MIPKIKKINQTKSRKINYEEIDQILDGLNEENTSLEVRNYGNLLCDVVIKRENGKYVIQSVITDVQLIERLKENDWCSYYLKTTPK